jgi:hypothetical protein
MAQMSKKSEAYTLRATENMESMNISKTTNSLAVKIRGANPNAQKRVANLSSDDENDRVRESEGSEDEDYPMHRPSEIEEKSKITVKKMKTLESGQGVRRANPHASVESLTARISHRPRNKK